MKPITGKSSVETISAEKENASIRSPQRRQFLSIQDKSEAEQQADCEQLPDRLLPRGFVKMMRGHDIEDLIETLPAAFVVATVIALRSRYMPGRSLKGIEQGQAFIGDFKKCGLSRAEYRYALKKLVEWGFVATKTTNKGTIAWLLDSRLFEVITPQNSQLFSQRVANKQPSSSQRVATTERKVRRGERNNVKKRDFEESTSASPEVPSSCFSHSKPENEEHKRESFRGPSDVAEVIAFSAAQAGYSVEDVTRVTDWLKHFNVKRPAGEIIDAIAKYPALVDAFQRAFRFVRYCNKNSWNLRHSWQAAFTEFAKPGDYCGITEVPIGWIPLVEQE